MKKVATLLLVLMLLTVSIVGCQAKPNEASTKPEAAETKTDAVEEMEIRFLNRMTSTTAAYQPLQDAIAVFEEENPNISVVYDACDTNTWRQRAVVEFSGSNPPGLAWSPASYANEFIADDLIVDWTDIYNDPNHPEFKEWFAESTLKSVATADGKLPFLPYEAYAGVITYNKAIFEEHGWEIPETFDELLALCDEMNAAGVAPFVTGGLDNRYAWLASILMLRAAGLDNINTLINEKMDSWDDPQYGLKTTLEKLQQLVDHGFFHSGCAGMTQDDSFAAFVRGEAAMFFEGTYIFAAFKNLGGDEFMDKIDIFPFPVMTDCPDGDSDAEAIVGGTPSGFIISANQTPEEIEACIELAKVTARPDVYSSVMESNSYLYAGTIEYNRDATERVTNDLYDYYISCMEGGAGAIYPFDSLLPASLDSMIKATVFPGIVAGDITVEEGVKLIADEARAINETKNS